ncbi:MAG: hypothetical protein GWP12_03910 [Nitrospirae bacterium]|nr:hypothetical protein [Nitrospirota bacterium]
MRKLLYAIALCTANAASAYAAENHVGSLDERTAPLDERTAQSAVELFCQNLDPAVAFYEKLGFEVERQARPFTAMRGYGMYIFLNSHEHTIQGERWVTLRVITPDVDQLAKRFEASGVKFEHPLGDRDYGMREFTVVDPCGFVVRFARPLEWGVAGTAAKAP